MGNLGFAEMAVIAVVALLVVGPDRLPEVARKLAGWIARFRTEATKSIDELKRAAQIEDLEGEWRGISDELKGIRSSFNANAMLTATPRDDDRPPPTDPEAT